MRGWLYDCDDLETGAQYRGLPSGRLIQILDGYTSQPAASMIFKNKHQDVHTVAGRFVLYRYRDDITENAAANLWRSHPGWCKRFCEEWAAACDKIRRYAGA